MRPPHRGSKPSTNPLGLLFASWRFASIGDVLCKQVFKGHVMSNVSKKKSPLDHANLISKHEPRTAMGMITDLISDSGSKPKQPL
jgi:hypothetical protein